MADHVICEVQPCVERYEGKPRCGGGIPLTEAAAPLCDNCQGGGSRLVPIATVVGPNPDLGPLYRTENVWVEVDTP